MIMAYVYIHFRPLKDSARRAYLPRHSRPSYFPVHGYTHTKTGLIAVPSFKVVSAC